MEVPERNEEEEMITYQELRKIQAKERENSELQELGEDFIEEIVAYVAAKRNALKEVKGKDSVFSKDSASEIEQELRNVLNIIRDIYDRRQRKILSQAMISLRTGSLEDTSKMFKFENEMYDKILTILKSYRSNFFEDILKRKPKTKPTTETIKKPQDTMVKKPQEEVVLLRITSDVPPFVWRDGETYGPFVGDDVVSMPKGVAEILLNTEKAKVVEGNQNETAQKDE